MEPDCPAWGPCLGCNRFHFFSNSLVAFHGCGTCFPHIVCQPAFLVLPSFRFSLLLFSDQILFASHASHTGLNINCNIRYQDLLEQTVTGVSPFLPFSYSWASSFVYTSCTQLGSHRPKYDHLLTIIFSVSGLSVFTPHHHSVISEVVLGGPISYLGSI